MNLIKQLNMRKWIIVLSITLTLGIVNDAFSQAKKIDSLTTLLKRNNLPDSIKCKILDQLMIVDEDNYYSWNDELIRVSELALKKALNKKDKDLFTEWLADANYNKGCEYEELNDTTNTFICFRKCLNLYKANGNQKEYADTEYGIGVVYERRELYSQAITYYLKAKAGHEAVSDDDGLSQTLNSLGLNYSKIGDFEKSLMYYKKSLTLAEKLQDKYKIARAYSNMGLNYELLGDIQKSLEYKLKSLSILETIEKNRDVGTVLNNIALLYNGQNDFENAFKYYNKSKALYTELKDTAGLGLVNANIGALYVGLSDNISYSNKAKKDSLLNIALAYTLKSLEYRKIVKYQGGIATTTHNLGRIYNSLGNEEKALELFNEAFEMRKNINDKRGIAGSLNCIADLISKTQNKKLKNLTLAKEYGEKSLAIAKEIGVPYDISTAALTLKYIYKKQGMFEKALQMHELYIEMKDSINNEVTRKAAKNQEFKYEWEKRENELKSEQEKKDLLVAEEKKRQGFVIYAVAGILILVIVFSVFLYRRFKVTQKQKIIIERKERETSRQKHLIEEKQKEITDSITYAKRLQQAILPPSDYIDKFIPNNFVYYKPKDIVAGDFYWAENINDLFFIAAADSTGHGVPGAMVSVVCSNALNRSVKEFNLTITGEILDKTRELVLETFEKSTDEVKDGMDISLLCIDKTNKKIFWSGANNPLWYIQDNNLLEIKANKQSIGKTDNSTPFTTHELQYNTGTIFYLFTDGYADQFGGPKGKKFKYKQLEELLLKNYQLPMVEQVSILDTSFEKWKNDLEQVDDVCIIGVMV